MNVGIAILDCSLVVGAREHMHVVIFDGEKENLRDQLILCKGKELVDFYPAGTLDGDDEWREGLEALKHLCHVSSDVDTVLWRSLSLTFREGRESVTAGKDEAEKVKNYNYLVNPLWRIYSEGYKDFPEAMLFLAYLVNNHNGQISDVIQRLFNQVYLLGITFEEASVK